MEGLWEKLCYLATKLLNIQSIHKMILADIKWKFSVSKIKVGFVHWQQPQIKQQTELGIPHDSKRM
jgi:hypothetical protein